MAEEEEDEHRAILSERSVARKRVSVQNHLRDRQEIIRTVAIMLAAGLAAELVARFLRVPPMVLLLVAGCLLGPEVLGAVDLPLDDTGSSSCSRSGSRSFCSTEGLGSRCTFLRRVVLGLGLLAVPGVLITAVVVGLGASWAFGIPVDEGILIGAVLAPTDPAILIPLFERTRVRPKVPRRSSPSPRSNDPTGAVLALSVAAFVVGGGGSFDEPLFDFVKALAISVVVGIGARARARAGDLAPPASVSGANRRRLRSCCRHRRGTSRSTPWGAAATSAHSLQG